MKAEYNHSLVNTIIFDLWDTLATKQFSVSECLRSHFHIPNTDNYLVQYEKAIQTKHWNSERTLSINFLKSFNLPVSEESINFIVELMSKVSLFAKVLPGVKQLLKELKKSYTLVLLSNTSCFEGNLTASLGLKTFFDYEIFSWQTGLLKPNKEAFLEACRLLEKRPVSCAYIDTAYKNIQIAKSLGMCVVYQESLINIRNKFLDESSG